MTEYNIDLAEKVLKSIINNPDKHDQGSWFHVDDEPLHEEREVELDLDTIFSEEGCGTSACAAGWALLHNGWKFKEIAFYDESQGYFRRIDEIEKNGCTIEDPDFVTMGEQALGLYRTEARELFLSMSDDEAIAALYSIVKRNAFPQEYMPDFIPDTMLEEEDEYVVDLEIDRLREIATAELCSAAYAEYEEKN